MRDYLRDLCNRYECECRETDTQGTSRFEVRDPFGGGPSFSLLIDAVGGVWDFEMEGVGAARFNSAELDSKTIENILKSLFNGQVFVDATPVLRRPRLSISIGDGEHYRIPISLFDIEQRRRMKARIFSSYRIR